MALNVPASQAFLKNLKCAYTGKPVTVQMVASEAQRALYFSPDAFDPSDFHETPEGLFAGLGTRDGVRGAARNGSELICPYTGETMTVVYSKGFGYRASGGFRPGALRQDPIDFARGMLMRNGVVPAGAPKHAPPPRITPRDETEPAEAKPSLSGGAAEAADKVLRDLAPPKVSVTVRGRRKKGSSRG